MFINIVDKLYGPTILSGTQFKIYADKILLFISMKKEKYKICRFEPIFEYENEIPLQSESDLTNFNSRDDNNLVWKSIIYSTQCKISRDDILTKKSLIPLSKGIVYINNCIGTCFTIEFNITIKMMAFAIWFNKKEIREKITKRLCSDKLIFNSIIMDSKSICKDIFQRDTSLSEVYMAYANCKDRIFIKKNNKLVINLNIERIEVVEMAVYSVRRIENLPLKCITKKIIIINTVKNQNKSIIHSIHINNNIKYVDNNTINKSYNFHLNKATFALIDHQISSCFRFHYNSGFLTFTFQFATIVLIKSITFDTGISLKKHTSFFINEFSSAPDAVYRDILDNVNKCKQTLISNFSFNGWIIFFNVI